MQTTFALAALAAMAYAIPQGVTGEIAPSTSAPDGCSADYSGTFQITAVNSVVIKREIYKRACGDSGSLVITLAGGQLHDAKGRTGYIAANYQFQFDDPPQAGAIYTAGFSACNNGSLALGGSNVFYECLSGDFYNLYDRKWASHCQPILIDIIPCGSSGDPVGQQSDGQPTGTGIATVTEISDGQPQAPTATVAPVPITQISDGQPQAPTATVAPVPITQISDGQPQAPTATVAPVPITQISDGQPQAPTATVAPVPISQISDGQPQAPTATATVAPVPISQISDGQPQAPVSTVSIAPSFVTSPAGTAPLTLPGGSFATSIAVPSNTSVPVAPSAPSATTAPPTTGNGNALKSSLGLAAVAMIAAVFL
jgi:hypothetical protein